VIGVVGRRVRLRQGGRGKGAQGGEKNKALDQHCADVGRSSTPCNRRTTSCRKVGRCEGCERRRDGREVFKRGLRNVGAERNEGRAPVSGS